jgi:hypothetical protein
MPEYRIEDNLVPITKGKEGLRGFGFEPAFNEFYDLYASDKVLSKSILRLEDIALYLYLRKCVNVEKEEWKPPSIRHLKRKFRIGADTLYEILERLEGAHLLRKVSGARGSGNVPNQYHLFDPLPQEEFIEAARVGAFSVSSHNGSSDQGSARGVPASGPGVFPPQEQGCSHPRNRAVPASGSEAVLTSGTITDLSGTDLVETDLHQTDTAAVVCDQLLDFAEGHHEHLARDVAQELVGRATLEQIEGWIDYVEHKGSNLTSPLGFLISKLRKGEPPPDAGTRWRLSVRDPARRARMRERQSRILESRGVSREIAQGLLDLWADVLSSVRNQTTSEIFEEWFSETVLLEKGDGRTVIGVPSDVHQHILGERKRPLIERAFNYADSEMGELVFEVYEQGGQRCT